MRVWLIVCRGWGAQHTARAHGALAPTAAAAPLRAAALGTAFLASAHPAAYPAMYPCATTGATSVLPARLLPMSAACNLTALQAKNGVCEEGRLGKVKIKAKSASLFHMAYCDLG
jgi:hypothetical protein